jgi:hypothetical protein
LINLKMGYSHKYQPIKNGAFDETRLLWLDGNHYDFIGLFRPLLKEGLTVIATKSCATAFEMLHQGIDYLVSAGIKVDNDIPDLGQRDWYGALGETEYKGLDFVAFARESFPQQKIGIMSSIRPNLTGFDETVQYAKQNLGVDFWLVSRGLLPSRVYEQINQVWRPA